MYPSSYHLKSSTIFLTLLLLAFTIPTSGAEVAPRVARFDSASLAETARQVRMGGVLRLEGLPMGLEKSGDTLVLKRVRVFTDDALIVVHTESGDELLPVPKNVYFRGSISGDPRSRVSLAVRERGEVRGIVAAGNRHWLLMTDAVGRGYGPLVAHEVDPTTGVDEKAAGFSCTTDELLGEFGGNPSDGPTGKPLNLVDLFALPLAPAQAKMWAEKGVNPSHTARVAIETDFEYYNKFGNATDATDYISDVFCFMSGIYAAEVDTSILVSSVSLWSTSGDPFTETNSGCALYEFGKYWNDFNGAVSRTIAHLFSGKSGQAGTAWIGVLCHAGSTQFVNVAICNTLTESVDNYVGGYGRTGGIVGNFDPNSPSVLWDIAGTSHEIGHNFKAHHTHCWAANVSGVNIDDCWIQNSCNPGATTALPAGCGNNNGCGTIMSYCQLRSGGFSNISLTLGMDHPYGVDPDRVPAWMNTHVLSVASSGCVDFMVKDGIFSDGFESGDTTEWSAEE